MRSDILLGVLAVCGLLGLVGCETKPVVFGEPVAAPRGYVEMCVREPESVLCKK